MTLEECPGLLLVARKLCTSTSLVVVGGSLVNAAVPGARGGIETKEGRKGRKR